MLTTLEDMKNIDVRTINREDLVERRSVKINPNASREERLADYIAKIKNPYCYKDGETVVKISFANTDTTMEDCIAHYLKGL